VPFAHKGQIVEEDVGSDDFLFDMVLVFAVIRFFEFVLVYPGFSDFNLNLLFF